MKKAMMVMTILAVSSFLVSMLGVAPLLAVEATQTGPTPKQVPAQKPTQQLKKDQVMAHTKFWEFEFDRVVVKGVTIKKGGGNKTINVKVGENVNFTLHYLLKTPPIKEIFESDAGAWGSGALCYYNQIEIRDKESDQFVWNPMNLKYLPKFTWADVQFWKNSFLGTARKTWTEQMSLQWTPTPQFAGHNLYIKFCCVNCSMAYKDIPEVDRKNNGFTHEDVLVTFIVAP